LVPLRVAALHRAVLEVVVDAPLNPPTARVQSRVTTPTTPRPAPPTDIHRRPPPVAPHIVPRPSVIPTTRIPARPTARGTMSKIAPHINLALMQEKGEGDQKDFQAVLKCYLKAVKRGHAYAQFAVGKLYFEGKDVAKDYNKSMMWYLKAADQRLPEAQDAICDLYFYGHGVPKDDSKALEWAFKAADQGFPAGIRSVAVHYHEGLGVTQDYALALKWHLKAADLGDADAL
ncbi:hypothetical protein BGW39_004665, partial [Mortierella sp. 14UC]